MRSQRHCCSWRTSSSRNGESWGTEWRVDILDQWLCFRCAVLLSTDWLKESEDRTNI
jgi:hypothetical protein